jgi:hypothetical protein
MERSTTMTTEQTGMLVLKNAAGDYFLLPQDVLERGRVREERKAELEQAIAAAQGGTDMDVQGYILPLVYGIAMTVGFAAGYFGTKSALGEEILVPTIEFPSS